MLMDYKGNVTLSVPDSVIPTTTGFSALHILGPVPASWGIYVQNKSWHNVNVALAQQKL